MPFEQGDSSRVWDVIIVGAGPAGLSAALILGRCRRSVLVCDRGTPRSWASKAMHGFLSRDPIAQSEFHQLSIDELSRYDGVKLIQLEVTQIRQEDAGFSVGGNEGPGHRCRKLLIATGLFDELPKIDGIFSFFGISVFQCPYCDGWEMRDKAVAVYGRGVRGYQMARAMTAWTRDIVLCTDGPAGLSPSQRDALARNAIPIVEMPISELIGKDGMLESIAFENGDVRPCHALFFDTPSKPQSNLAQRLGCAFARDGGVRCGRYAESSIPGIYAAGNITRDVQLAIVAAAEGAKAAFGINRSLTREEFELNATGRRIVEHPAGEAADQKE
jgi:thioredoxin reductase